MFLASAANSRRDRRIPLCMTLKLRISTLLAAALLCGPVVGWSLQSQPSPPQPTAKQDMKNAGHDTKNAAKSTARGVKKGTKKAYHSTKRGTKKAYGKTKSTVKGAADGAKEGARQPQ